MIRYMIVGNLVKHLQLCTPMTYLHNALPLPYEPVSVTRKAWSHIGILLSILAAEPLSTVGFLLHSQYLCGMILLALYSMVRTDGF